MNADEPVDENMRQFLERRKALEGMKADSAAYELELQQRLPAIKRMLLSEMGGKPTTVDGLCSISKLVEVGADPSESNLSRFNAEKDDARDRARALTELIREGLVELWVEDRWTDEERQTLPYPGSRVVAQAVRGLTTRSP